MSTAPPQQLASHNNTITFNTNAQPQQQQPKELIDFFASLENEKVNIFYNPVIQQQPQQQQSMFAPPMITTQPTGHNPFRTNTADTSMQQLMVPPQQSTSSILPTINNVQQVNPFRASTMPQMSTSSPTPYFNHNNNNMNSFNNALVLQQQPQPQQTLSSSNNPFTLSNQQQQQPLPQTIMVASPNTLNNNNPFSNTANKQQQLQPWGSSIF